MDGGNGSTRRGRRIEAYRSVDVGEGGRFGVDDAFGDDASRGSEAQ